MTEQQPYVVVGKQPGFELRRYPDYLVAEMVVTGSFESAGNRAFRSLAAYISGRNRSRAAITMTAPVLQEGERLAMTAPVLQEGTTNRTTVAFVMPASLDPGSVPVPEDPRVTTRLVAGHLAAAARYSGRWSERAFREHEATLLEQLPAAGLRPAGPARWARYNPPWTPWFLRRNEVIVPVADADGTARAHI